MSGKNRRQLVVSVGWLEGNRASDADEHQLRRHLSSVCRWPTECNEWRQGEGEGAAAAATMLPTDYNVLSKWYSNRAE